MSYKIALVDNDADTIKRLTAELTAPGNFEIVVTAINGADLLLQLEYLHAQQFPQVIVTAIDMPIMDGIETVKACRKRYKNLKYIMLISKGDDGKLYRAIKAGAGGYFLKEEASAVITDVISGIAREEKAYHASRRSA